VTVSQRSVAPARSYGVGNHALLSSGHSKPSLGLVPLSTERRSAFREAIVISFSDIREFAATVTALGQRAASFSHWYIHSRINPRPRRLVCFSHVCEKS